MSAWTDVLTVAALQSWLQIAPWLLLAALRWLGCLLWLPGLSAAGVSFRMRVVSAGLLSIVMLPAIVSAVGAGVAESITETTFIGWLAMAVSEFVIGCTLGLAVRLLFSALALAGELIDHQTGVAMRQVLLPARDDTTGPTGSALSWMAAGAILLGPSAGGEFAPVQALLNQFSAMPPGSAAGIPRLTLIIVLVQQSLVLALQVAAPFLAVTSLITLAAGWLGRSSPRLRVDAIATPVRVVVCLALMAAVLPGFGPLFADQFDALCSGASQMLLPSQAQAVSAGVSPAAGS